LGAAAVAATVLSVGVAQAAGDGNLYVCSDADSGIWTYAEINGSWDTSSVGPGDCQQYGGLNLGDTVDVYESYDNVSFGDVGSFTYTSDIGGYSAQSYSDQNPVGWFRTWQ